MANHPNRSKVINWPEHLKRFRAKHRLSQAQLADKLMISARNVENWEAGINLPPAYLKMTLQALEEKLVAS